MASAFDGSTRQDQSRLHRALLRVESVDRNRRTMQIVAPDWNPDVIITFSLFLLPPDLASWVREGSCLLATANIGAAPPESLFFSEFERAVTNPPSPQMLALGWTGDEDKD